MPHQSTGFSRRRKNKMRHIRELQSYIHDGTLQDIIAVHLQAMSIVNDDEEFISITVGERQADGKRPINYKIIKTREVELIVHS